MLKIAQNSNLKVTDKRSNQFAQKQKLSIAGFQKLQEMTFDQQIEPDNQDLSDGQPDHTSGDCDQLENRNLPKQLKGVTGSTSAENQYMTTNQEGTDDQCMDIEEVIIPRNMCQNGQESESEDKQGSGLPSDAMKSSESGLDAQKEGDQTQSNQLGKHKKDTDENEKVPLKENFKGRGVKILNENDSTKMEETAVRQESTGAVLSRSSQILNNQNKVQMRQVESPATKRQRTGSGSNAQASQNISSLLKKILKQYSTAKNEGGTKKCNEASALNIDKFQSKTKMDEQVDVDMDVANQHSDDIDYNFTRKNENEQNNKINCQIISFNDSKNKNLDKQMRDSSLQAKAQLLRQLSGQVSLNQGQKIQEMGLDQTQKANQLQQILLGAQEFLKNKQSQKDGPLGQQFDKGCYRNSVNGVGSALKCSDQSEGQQSKEMQNSLSKLAALQQANTVHVSTTARPVDSEDINNSESIENRKQQNSQENLNITEILAKLQSIQRQSSQTSNAANKQFQLQQRNEAVNSLKSLKQILAERGGINQQAVSSAHDGSSINKFAQIEQVIQKKDTTNAEKMLSPKSYQQFNRGQIKNDIPMNQSVNKSADQSLKENNDSDQVRSRLASNVGLHIKGQTANQSADVTNPNNQTEPRQEEKLIPADCEMSTDNRPRAYSKVEARCPSQVLDQADAQGQKSAANDRVASISSKKQSEERAREEISSLMNLIKSNINCNPKYKNLNAEDNGALQSIMNKLEGSISIANQNKNASEADKDKQQLAINQGQDKTQEKVAAAESKLNEQNATCDGMIHSDNVKEQKQPFNTTFLMQPGMTDQHQQLQSKASSNQDSSHLQLPLAAQKAQTSKDYSLNGATTTAGFTDSNQTTVMSQTNGNVKGPSNKVPNCNQPQASLNIGEPTATAVTRQTTIDAMDPRFKKMQAGFLLNHSSPLGKFNAQSSQIVESHQNIFRVPQSHQQQAVPVASASGQNSHQIEKYGQIKQILQMLQSAEPKKDSINHSAQKDGPQEDKVMDTGIAAVARQASRGPSASQASLRLPLSTEQEQRIKQQLSPQQIQQIKSIPALAQILNLDLDGQPSPGKTPQSQLQEPPSGHALRKMVLGNQNDQLQRSLSLQSSDYLASIAHTMSMNGQNSHTQGPNSAVGGVNSNANGASANQDGAAVAMNQQMLKAVRQFLVGQQGQQDGGANRSSQNNQIQMVINALTSEVMAGQQDNNTLANLKRSLSGTSGFGGLQALLQPSKQHSEVGSAQQTPLQQLLGFQNGEKSANIVGQVKALGLDLGNTPIRGQDSFIIKDIDSPSKMRMRTFLDRQMERQRSTTTMNDFEKQSLNCNAEALQKQNQLQSLLLGTSPNRNNQELSILQNMINDEEDDRFGNIKMSDEEISPQAAAAPGDGFLSGGSRLGVSHRSKGIKKDNGFAHLGHHHNGFAPHSALTLGQSHSYDPQSLNDGLLRSSDEKIQDKGEYYLIHRMNTKTKRLNQILQCKQCPMKFPKLCNLRDHVRIHKEDMPFKCSLCNKAFTQAGNRDRHESKRVCLRRNNTQQSPSKGPTDAKSSEREGESPASAPNASQPQDHGFGNSDKN